MIDVNSLPFVEKASVWDSIVLIPTGDECDFGGDQWYHVIGEINLTPTASLGVHDVILFEDAAMPYVNMTMDGCVRIHLGPHKRMLVDGYTSTCTIKVAR